MKGIAEKLISVCLIMVVAVACSLLCTFLVSYIDEDELEVKFRLSTIASILWASTLSSR